MINLDDIKVFSASLAGTFNGILQIDVILKVAANKLAGSDWMVVRAAEGGTAVPQDWAEWRVAVRAASNDAEAAAAIINAGR